MEEITKKDDWVLVPSSQPEAQQLEASEKSTVRSDTDSETELHWAAFTGKYETVKTLLSEPRGILMVNKKNSHGETPLHGACRYGHLYICNLLIENGADLNAITAKKSAAIHEACKGIAATSVHPEHAISILRLLVARKVQPDTEDEDRNYPVHYVCRGKRVYNKQSVSKKALKILIRAGANIDVLNSRGCNPLHTACMTGDHNVIVAICKQISSPDFINKQDIDGQTPLHWACYFGRVKAVKTLLEYGANPNLTNHGLKTPLSCAMGSAYAIKSLREIIDTFAPKMKIPVTTVKRVDSPPKFNRSPSRSRTSPSKASPRFRMLVQSSVSPLPLEDNSITPSPAEQRAGIRLIDNYMESAPGDIASSNLACDPAFIKSVQEMHTPGTSNAGANKDMTNDLFCPLTKKLMSDPVLAADGLTYERSAIEQWLKENRVSPMTRQIMHSTSVFPNPQIKERIRVHLERSQS